MYHLCTTATFPAIHHKRKILDILLNIKDFPSVGVTGFEPATTRPSGFHSCEVMGGRGSDFQWLVPLALANFTGTFVTRQPLLREGQAYAEIRRYGVYDAITFDEWSENNDIKPSSLCAENSN